MDEQRRGSTEDSHIAPGSLHDTLHSLGLGHCVTPLRNRGIVSLEDISHLNGPDDLPFSLTYSEKLKLVEYVQQQRTRCSDKNEDQL